MNGVDTSELKPCPFCGGEAEMREWDWPYVRFQCRCSKCKCQARARMAHRAEAIAAWNTRATDESMRDEIERLRLDLDAKDALNVSTYYAGMKAGWNFCVNEDQINFAAAIASTEHIAELQRINAARQVLGDSQ